MQLAASPVSHDVASPAGERCQTYPALRQRKSFSQPAAISSKHSNILICLPAPQSLPTAQLFWAHPQLGHKAESVQKCLTCDVNCSSPAQWTSAEDPPALTMSLEASTKGEKGGGNMWPTCRQICGLRDANKMRGGRNENESGLGANLATQNAMALSRHSSMHVLPLCRCT